MAQNLPEETKKFIIQQKWANDAIINLYPKTSADIVEYNNDTSPTAGTVAKALSDLKTSVAAAMETASGKKTTYVFDNREALSSHISANGGADYQIGDIFLLKSLDEPDYWLSNIGTRIEVDGEGFIVTGWGYTYAFEKLEARKIDLASYQTKAISAININGTNKTTVESALSALNTYINTKSSDNQTIKVGRGIFGSNAEISLNAGDNVTITPDTTENTITISAKDTTYNAATSTQLGLVKLGYSTNGKNYAVKIDTGNNLYVNVPWSDNNTTYTLSSGDANGQIKVTPSSGSAYNVDVTGLWTAAYTNSSAYTAANAAITAGTACKITYDSKGLVTKGESLASTDIPNLDASKITSGTFGADRIPNLASNKITAMTGYSKGSATSAITTSDSLNTAIGKLEKRLDGAATLSGNNIFSKQADFSAGIQTDTINASSSPEEALVFEDYKWKYRNSSNVTSEIATKADISNIQIPNVSGFATKVTPKQFASTSTVENVGDGAYTSFTVNSEGLITAMGHLIEVGTSTSSSPSNNLAVGGLFFKMI